MMELDAFKILEKSAYEAAKVPVGTRRDLLTAEQKTAVDSYMTANAESAISQSPELASDSRMRKYIGNETSRQAAAEQEFRDSVKPGSFWNIDSNTGGTLDDYLPDMNEDEETEIQPDNNRRRNKEKTDEEPDEKKPKTDNISGADGPENPSGDVVPETPPSTTPATPDINTPNPVSAGSEAATDLAGAGTKAAGAVGDAATDAGAAARTASTIPTAATTAGEALLPAGELAVEGVVAAESNPYILGITILVAIVLALGIFLLIISCLVFLFVKYGDSLSESDQANQTSVGLCVPFLSKNSLSTRGFVQLPLKSSDYLVQSGNSAHEWGTPELVSMLRGVSAEWNKRHPNVKITYSDMSKVNGGNFNPPHVSHQTGLDVDINSYTNPAFLMSKPHYDKNLATELGKLYIDSKAIDIILYNDSAVASAVNSYAKSKGLPGRMQSWPGHDNHFHLRIKKGLYTKACGY